MLVSIIIPCHNRSDYLRECLQSVVEQSYRQLEIIVVDDASEEDIASVVYSIRWPKEMRVRYLRTQTNVGPGASRELGRQRASGDFICYLDSDDLWHRDKVEAQIHALRNDLDAGMCYCPSAEFMRLPLTGAEPLRERSDQAFRQFLPTVLFGRPWGTSACMWRRKATDLIGPWSSRWTWEDYEYDTRAGCHDIQIAFVPHVLCYYRRSPEGQHLSLSSDRVRATRERALSLHKMFDELYLYRKFEDGEIHRRAIWLLYSQVVLLLRNHDKHLAVDSLRRIRHTCSPFSRVAIFSSLLQVALIVSPAPIVARVAAYSQKHILP